VAHYLDGITPEHLLDLDARMETMLQANFTALVHVCLTNQHILRQVERAMLETAAAYGSGLLPPASVAELFLEQHPQPDEAAGEIADFYQQAAPELSASRCPLEGPASAELTILAGPGDPATEQFRGLLQQAAPEAEVLNAGSPEDLLIYRERLNLPLLALEHLGPVGLDAYNQMTSTDHFTPHTRTDIDFKR
jgi:hypothetical protein